MLETVEHGQLSELMERADYRHQHLTGLQFS